MGERYLPGVMKSLPLPFHQQATGPIISHPPSTPLLTSALWGKGVVGFLHSGREGERKDFSENIRNHQPQDLPLFFKAHPTSFSHALHSPVTFLCRHPLLPLEEVGGSGADVEAQQSSPLGSDQVVWWPRRPWKAPSCLPRRSGLSNQV